MPSKSTKKPLKEKKGKRAKPTVSNIAKNTTSIVVKIGSNRRTTAARAKPQKQTHIQPPLIYGPYQVGAPVYNTYNGRDLPGTIDQRVDNLTYGFNYMQEGLRQQLNGLKAQIGAISVNTLAPQQDPEPVLQPIASSSMDYPAIDGQLNPVYDPMPADQEPLVGTVNNGFEMQLKTPVKLSPKQSADMENILAGSSAIAIKSDFNSPNSQIAAEINDSDYNDMSSGKIGKPKGVQSKKKPAVEKIPTFYESENRFVIAKTNYDQNPTPENEIELKRARNARKQAKYRLNRANKEALSEPMASSGDEVSLASLFSYNAPETIMSHTGY